MQKGTNSSPFRILAQSHQPASLKYAPIAELSPSFPPRLDLSHLHWSLPIPYQNPVLPPYPSSSENTLWAEISCTEKRKILLDQMAQFLNSYRRTCPTSSHLLTVTKVNVYRGFVSNMVTLGLTWEWMEEDSISPFTILRPGSEPLVLPEKLRPPALQRSRIHHTWIDFFPCPVMRNNLLQAGNDWDEELCGDIMGFWDGCSTGPHGLIVWGEPSDSRNWEITEGFLKSGVGLFGAAMR